MIFTFWTSADPDAAAENTGGEIDGAVKDWSSAFPEFRVFNDDEVARLLQSRDAELLAVYNAIRIPACRSDLARLVLLYEYGGLYIDAHVGTGDSQVLASVLEKLSTFELIIFDKTWEHKKADDIHIINTMICARRRSEVINTLIESAFANLIGHRAIERSTPEYVPYNIFVLTGAADITDRIFDQSALPRVMRSEFAEKVHVERLVDRDRLPFFPYKHYAYRQPGSHWSERQKVERLFLD